MAKKERSKRQGESTRRPATSASQPEESGKLPAEQERGERTHDRLVFRPRVDIFETEADGLIELLRIFSSPAAPPLPRAGSAPPLPSHGPLQSTDPPKSG
jgi:hypothetical protein